MKKDDKALVARQDEWNKVLQELDSENLKLASYDDSLIPLLGDINGKKVLDYGAGPGVLALALSRLGANTKVWDINSDMRLKSGDKIGENNVYNSLNEIPENYFDFVICNLVLCIVQEDEVKTIINNISAVLKQEGKVFIGFCNPKIFKVKESNLDFRFPTGSAYEENHNYKKIKKEGGYKMIELHRPIEWYERVYEASGLSIVKKHFTPEYELKGNRIQDFIIFELQKI